LEKNRQIFLKILFKVGSQKYKGYFFNLLSYLGCSQIWQNLPANHGHFGYNTKLTPKKHGSLLHVYCEMQVHHLGLFKILEMFIKGAFTLGVRDSSVNSPLTSC